MVWSPCCPRDSQESSPAPQFESINSSVLSLLYSPTFTCIHDCWKDHSLEYTDFCQQSDVFAFNTLSRFVTALVPRSNHPLISWLQSPSTVILEHKKKNEVMGLDAMIFSFKPVFSLSSFFFIKRIFSFSSISAIRGVSSAYLRLLILLLAILILACGSSSRHFAWYTLLLLSHFSRVWLCATP